MRLLFVIAAAAALSGCLTPQKVSDNIQSRWMGKHIDQAIVEFGPADKTANLQTGKIYQWSRGGKAAHVDTYYGQTYVTEVSRRCTWSFVTDQDGIIKDFNWRGHMPNCP